MTDPNDDRRHDPRIAKFQLVQVTRFNEEGFRADLATGRTLNISRGGLRLELLHPLPLRSEVTLSLALGNDIVDVHGRVTYLESLDDERSAMGIQFLDLSAEDARRIDAYLAGGG